MARPSKNNADYFPHDTGMRNNPRIRALRTKYGAEGFALYVMLLETIADADGLRLSWSALEIELLSGDFGVPTPRLVEIVEYMATLNLVQIIGGELVCESLRKRLEPLFAERERLRERRRQYRGQTEFAAGQTEFAAGQNPQSKVKESKVNLSIERSAQTRAETDTEKQIFFDEQTAYAAIIEGCKPDNWAALHSIADKAKFTAQHGPVGDQVKLFAAHYATHPQEATRNLFFSDPFAFFKNKGCAWLIQARQRNKTPQNANHAPAPRYTPAPRSSSAQPIGAITKLP